MVRQPDLGKDLHDETAYYHAGIITTQCKPDEYLTGIPNMDKSIRT